MNINLTPEDRLGRMLHTFNANAYEIATYNIESLISNSLLQEQNKILGSLNYEILTLNSGEEKPMHNATKVTVKLTAIGKGAYPTLHVKFIHADGTFNIVQVGPSPLYEYFIDKSNPVVGVVNLDYRYSINVEYWYEEEESYPIFGLEKYTN